VTMTLAQRDAMLQRFPAAAHRVFTFIEYQRLVTLALPRSEAGPAMTLEELTSSASRRRADSGITPADDIEDPYRLPSSVHETVGQKIDDAVSAVVRVWAPAARGNAAPVDAPDNEGSEPLRIRIIETDLELRCTGGLAADARAAIEEAWAWCLSTPTDTPADIVLEAWCQDHAPREAVDAAWRRGAVAGTSVTELMHFLSSVATTSAITAQAGKLLMLHGCAVAMPDGQVVAFVGPSGMGKTTVASTLAQQFGYVTDETVAVRFDGEVVAYPKPLSLVVRELHDAKRQVSPVSAGLLPAPGELRLAAVVLLDRRQDGPEVPLITQVDLLEGLAELAAQVSFLAHIAQPLHTFSEVIERVGGITRVTYREAATLATVMPTLLGATE